MKSESKLKRLIGAVILLELLLVLYGCTRPEGPDKEAKSNGLNAAEGATPLKVAVEKVKRSDLRNIIWVTGEVVPSESVDVVSKVSGHLESMRRPNSELIEEGVTVQKGEIIAVIDHKQFDAAVSAARASLNMALAAKETAGVNLSDAIREKTRWVNLQKQGAGSDQQRDQAVAGFERAEAQMKQVEAQIGQAKATLEQAEVNLNDATIVAPVSGIVSLKYVDEGAFVGPSVPLFKIIVIDQVEITGAVADRYYTKLEVEKTMAEVEVDAYPEEIFKGCVARIRPELDKPTRTFAVTVCVPNKDLKLKPGMYARIRLIIDEHKDTLNVPDDALITSNGDTKVYVVNGGTVRERLVTVGLEEGSRNEILEGLNENDMVIVRSHNRLTPGMKVDAQEVDAK